MIVSIIIPFRDKVNFLEKCIASILKKPAYNNFNILLIDNNSKEAVTKKYLSEISKNSKVKIIDYPKSFNFSAINNFAAKEASGEHLLFLNNDTEVISENWLEEMLKCFDDEKVGAVGAKLLYPNGKIQHIGIEMHPKYGPAHTSRMSEEKNIDFSKPREVMAVTAACMMTRKDLFLKLGGFDEKNLPIAYNDVDYCLRLRERGYKIMCAPNAKLYHCESASRLSDADIFALIFRRKRHKQFIKERNYIKTKWAK